MYPNQLMIGILSVKSYRRTAINLVAFRQPGSRHFCQLNPQVHNEVVKNAACTIPVLFFSANVAETYISQRYIGRGFHDLD